MMTQHESRELSRLRECVQNLTIQVARLSQAVEPLALVQEDLSRLRDRMAELEGFRAAALWLAGLISAGAAANYLLAIWTGGMGH